MGSPCTLLFFDENQHKATYLIDACLHELQRLEQKYSRYLPDSFLSKINAAGRNSIEIDEETAALLNYANTAYDESEGLFDITSGLFRSIWNFKEKKIPDHRHIQEILKKVGWEKVYWENNFLQFSLEGMEIDLGGIVKEHAADLLFKLFAQSEVTSGLIDLGGDIKIIGPHPDGKPWGIGVTDPTNSTQARITLQLKHGAITTSGQYQRSFLHKGRRYGHLINPKTGWPVTGLISATVWSESCLIAGSLTSIAILKGYPDGKKWLDELQVSYVLINDKNELFESIGLKKAEKIDFMPA